MRIEGLKRLVGGQKPNVLRFWKHRPGKRYARLEIPDGDVEHRLASQRKYLGPRSVIDRRGAGTSVKETGDTDFDKGKVEETRSGVE